MGDREITEVDVPLNTELDRKIAEVFDVFDHSNSRRVDPREVGTIMRALGCCPTEAEVQELIVKMEDPQSPGSIFLGSFLPVMVEAITEHRFEPATADQLLEAFHVLDKEKVGFLPKEEMVNLITQDGEPFNQDELEEMMEIALDPQTQTIPYEYYINQLMVDQ